MNIEIFNKKYWIRHFEEQRIVKGYLTSGYVDKVVSLNVHPAGTDVMQALPEGDRKIKRLEGHGSCKLVVADYNTNTKGDLLFYSGNWYECVSEQEWNHTLLSHYNYQFTIVPRDAAYSIDIENDPKEEPK